MTDHLKRIADALEGIARMVREDRREMEEAQLMAEAFVDPADCDHPREHRATVEDGVFMRIGCSACGTADIRTPAGVR